MLHELSDFNQLKNTTKHIISTFLLALLISTAIVKFLHRDEHFICHEKNEKHFHNQQDDCPVCKFEISLFEENQSEVFFSNFILPDFHMEFSIIQIYGELTNLTFLLRAPPSEMA